MACVELCACVVFRLVVVRQRRACVVRVKVEEVVSLHSDEVMGG